jgi:hypothetical protein
MPLALHSMAEVHSMTNDPSRTPVQSLVDHPVAKTFGLTLPLVRAGVLAVSVAAAIPTAHNLYYSFAHGIPYKEVPHRLAQYDLWMKNLDCRIEYRQIATAGGTKVDVGACPTSRDIAIKVSGEGGHATYEWIAFDQLQKPQATSLLGLVVPAAYAEDAKPAPAAGGAFKVADNGLQVVCQSKSGNTIVRVIQEGGKCYREVVSLFRGTIEKRAEVPCSTTCK